MKKRGGVPKSSLKKTPSSSAITRNVQSSIVDRELINRASFFEPMNNKIVNQFKPELNDKPTKYTTQGQHTIFTLRTAAGLTKFTVNTLQDEEEQREALVRFNNKFRTIQNDFITKLNAGNLTRDQGHNGQWMCVTAGNGNWYPTGRRAGSWKMLPKEVKWDAGAVVTDELVKNEEWISARNAEYIYCVPKNHNLIMTAQMLHAHVIS
jgi:hypothetical protein